MTHQTKHKAVVSGNTVEMYSYLERPLEYGLDESRNRRPKQVGEWVVYQGRTLGVFRDEYGTLWEREKKFIDPENKQRYIKETTQRASTNIRRLTQANHGQYLEYENNPYQTKFLTSTFQDPTFTFLEQTNPYFTAFILSLNRHLYKRGERNLRYLTVPERQDRGVIHYHTLFFNLPYIDQKDLQDMWETVLPPVMANHQIRGMVDIRVRNDPKVVMYLTKYLVKNFGDPTMSGKRKYFPSLNLLRPRIFYDDTLVTDIAHLLKGEFPTYERTYDTIHHGAVTYQSFTTAQNILDTILDQLQIHV